MSTTGRFLPTMHIRLFAVFLSVLAIGFSYFGINDPFAIVNSETIRAQPKGWPSGKSIRSGFDFAEAFDADKHCTFGYPDSISCPGVHTTDGKHLLPNAATMMPATEWEIIQGINGKAHRTNKNTISYGDVQIPSTFEIPDMPNSAKLDEYILTHKETGQMHDWANVCLREEDDHGMLDNKYKTIYRDNQRIFDPYALDRVVYVLPIRIFGEYKAGEKAVKKLAAAACTYTFVFPTSEADNLYMMGCYQTTSETERRRARYAFGMDADIDAETREVSFRKFINAIKIYVDGYTSETMPAKDSFMGHYLWQYARHDQTTGNNPTRIGMEALVEPDFYLVDCKADPKSITAAHCATEASTTVSHTLTGFALRNRPWVKMACDVKADLSALEDKTDITKVVWRYPLEFTTKEDDYKVVLKTGATYKALHAAIDCEYVDADGDTAILKGGDGACTLEKTVSKTKVTFRIRDPTVDLGTMIAGIAQTDGTVKTLADLIKFDCESTAAKATQYPADIGTHVYKMTDAHWEGLFDFMEIYVENYQKNRGVTFDGVSMDGTHPDPWGGNAENQKNNFWQPLGPHPMTTSELCLSTMNSYHNHPSSATAQDKSHNGIVTYANLGGTEGRTCLGTDNALRHKENCRGQHATAQFTDGWGGNAANKASYFEQATVSRFATVDVLEQQLFRAIQYGWWYRGEDMLDDKMKAMSTLAHHTDQITDDDKHCDSFTSPSSTFTSRDERFDYTLKHKDHNHPMVLSMAFQDSTTHSKPHYAPHLEHSVGGIFVNKYANTFFDHVDQSPTNDLKCQNTCKNIKATNSVILVSGALYLISIMGLLMPYDDNSGMVSMQTKAFLVMFFTITTCFTVSMFVHAGSLQRIQTGKLECTFHNDTNFFEPSKEIHILENTDTAPGFGLILLWLGSSFSAMCWFITLALVIAVMQSTDQTYLGGVRVNEFFFNSAKL